MDREGDRRDMRRCEIVGELWGSLGVVERVPVRDIGRGGLLVESTRPLPILSIHRMRVVLDELEEEVEVRVNRLAPPGERDREGYFIGLEFVRIPPLLGERIDRLVGAERATGGPVATMGEWPGDRRRPPRVQVRGRGECRRIEWSPVRLLDISFDGVLLVGARALDVSARPELRSAFAAGPFASTIEIRWVGTVGGESAPASVLLGARFDSPDDVSRRALDRLLHTSTA